MNLETASSAVGRDRSAGLCVADSTASTSSCATRRSALFRRIALMAYCRCAASASSRALTVYLGTGSCGVWQSLQVAKALWLDLSQAL